MKVVGINGSGRKGRNTAVLVKAILDGAKSSGAETELMELADWNIRGCDSNFSCKKTYRCRIKDDMQKFYEIAPETDVIVLASPIYLSHITAQMMTFIQRQYCYLGEDLKPRWPRKSVKMVLGITYGWDNPTAYDGVLSWMEEQFGQVFGIPTVAKFKLVGTSIESDVTSKHPEIQRAFAFGKTFRGA